MTPDHVLKCQLSSLLVTFVKKYSPFTASLAIQKSGFYKELWLSGAVTPARCPEVSEKSEKMRTLDILKRYRHQNGLVLLLLLV